MLLLNSALRLSAVLPVNDAMHNRSQLPCPTHCVVEIFPSDPTSPTATALNVAMPPSRASPQPRHPSHWTSKMQVELSCLTSRSCAKGCPAMREMLQPRFPNPFAPSLPSRRPAALAESLRRPCQCLSSLLDSLKSSQPLARRAIARQRCRGGCLVCLARF